MWQMPHCHRIVKLVRALRKGWIKRDRQVAPQEPATYLMWDDDLQTEDKTLAGGLFNDSCVDVLLCTLLASLGALAWGVVTGVRKCRATQS
jgi:hypothetical protein